MTWPLIVKSVPVFMTDRPVTQHALVEVKSASIKVMPFVVILGIMSKNVPVRIRNKNESTIIAGGLRLNLVRNPEALDNSIDEIRIK